MKRHFTKDELRRLARDRIAQARRALSEHDLFSQKPVAQWISAAPGRANRRLMLEVCLAIRIARGVTGPSMKSAGLSPGSVKKWAHEIGERERENSEFAAAIEAALTDIEKGMANKCPDRAIIPAI